ncbi:MAG: amino acid ABC transporter substrate-binding protein [Alphaproteobacteria bacterium]|nr:amino acid ABC transporter substrate-binding protein [Alphaproteobacteria bacterium]
MKAITLLFVLGFAALSGTAHSQAVSESHLDRVRRLSEVRVCIWPDYYSISYRNTRTGNLEGIDIDLAKEFAKDLGVAVRFVDSSFKALIEDLTADKCDISMHAVGITPLRQEKLDFTRPHLRSGILGVTTKAHPTLKSWADVDQDGMVVVVATGTFMEPVMKDYLKKAKLISMDTPEAREQEVMSGRADVFMTDYPFSRKMLARHDWAKLVEPPQQLAPTSYAYAVNKGDPKWLEAVDAFVASAKKDGRLLKAAEANGLSKIVNLDDVR